MNTSQSSHAQTLISQGWKLYNTCYCGGSYNEDYKNPNVSATIIRVTPEYNRFIITVHDNPVRRGNSGLLEALNSLKEFI